MTSIVYSFPFQWDRKVQDRVVQEEHDQAIYKEDNKQIHTIVANPAFKAGYL